MLRSTRPVLNVTTRGLPKPSASISSLPLSQTRRSASSTTWRARVPTTASSRQLVPLMQRARFAAKNERDVEFEKEVAQKKLKVDPEHVTVDSSTRGFDGIVQPAKREPDDGLKGDFNRVQDALALGDVPRLSYQLGLAGTIPYLGTSLATVYCSWDMNTDWPSQSQFLNHIMVSHEQAAHYLHLLEPLQVGYGAVIISFLGAIHWGLEYAEKTPNAARSRFRYGLGVAAPIVAWSTVALPVQFALTAQFAAFVLMYYADARAATRAWAPQWYGTYRFVLTFIVGSAILISLIGREKVGSDKPRLTGLREKFHKEGHDTMAQHEWEKLEEKELERNRKKKALEEKRKALEEEEKKQEEAEKKQQEEEKAENEKSSGKKGKKQGDDKKEKEDKPKDEKKEGSDDKKEKDDKSKDEKDEGSDDKQDKDDKSKEENEDNSDDKKEEKSD